MAVHSCVLLERRQSVVLARHLFVGHFIDDRTSALSTNLSASAHTFSEALEHSHSGGPVDAAVSDRLAVVQVSRAVGWNALFARVDVGLEHDADDVVACLGRGELGGHVFGDDGLVVVVLFRVAVAAIDHDARVEAGLGQRAGDRLNVGLVVVGATVVASHDDVGGRVARGLDDGSLASA